MNIGAYSRAVGEGVRSFVLAALGWRDNPYANTVGRRLWGPLPWLGFGAPVVAGIALSPFLPSIDRIAGFVPPLAFLQWMPEDVFELLWSVPALFNLAVVAVAWVALRNRAGEQPFWTSQPGSDDEHDDEPELPPLPTEES
jgi:hypothetical protein